jgi:DNA (cytosine-5)-methyltransferase 1
LEIIIEVLLMNNNKPLNLHKNELNLKVACYSLFSGPGGLDLGFERAGAKILYAADIDQTCVETYNANRINNKAIAKVRDLRQTTVDSILSESLPNNSYDLLGLIGGPPCQSFSYANVSATDEDPRHRLPEHYARILDGLRKSVGLDFFLFENVPGITSYKHLERFERFRKMFEEAGFNIFQGSLNAVDFGVAQIRPRVFIVGINKEKFPNVSYAFPIPSGERKTVREVIEGLPEPILNQKGLDPKTFPIHPNHWCLVPRSPKFKEGFPKKMGGKSFKVLDWDQPSYTVAYGHREVHIHPNGHRRLSMYEALLLQGFPQNYFLVGNMSAQVRQVSEAVCPEVAFQLAKSILQMFNGISKGEEVHEPQRDCNLAEKIS